MNFFSTLRKKQREGATAFCLGIDPDIPPASSFLSAELAKMEPFDFLLHYAETLLDALEPELWCVKFQSAYFERFGSEGVRALVAACALAKSRGLMVILDAKRGDISSTMAAYGDFAFSACRADCLTINPYMGSDVWMGLQKWFDQGRCAYAVWLTSNASATSVQEKIIVPLAEEMRKWQASFEEPALGLVCGATRFAALDARQLQALKGFDLLAPGVGAQGAAVDQSFEPVKKNAASILVPVSRGICSEAALNAPSWAEFKKVLMQNSRVFFATL